MATHSSILAWRIPWTEEPGKLQSMGLAARSVLPSNRPATPLFSPACWEPGFQDIHFTYNLIIKHTTILKTTGMEFRHHKFQFGHLLSLCQL